VSMISESSVNCALHFSCCVHNTSLFCIRNVLHVMIFVGMVMVYTGLLSEPTATTCMASKYVMKLDHNHYKTIQ